MCLGAFLVAQMLKKLPAVQETQVRFLGQEDPLEKGMTSHSIILVKNSMDRGAWQATVHGIHRTESLHCSPETTTTLLIIYTPIQNEKFKV